MPIKKTGDWDRVRRLIADISPEMQKARQQSLQRFGLKLETITKKHISAQDLGWVPLNSKYLATKVRKGYSENILVMSSTYFKSITSWVQGGICYTGVTREMREDDGTLIADIAKIHEFGSISGTISARPLWVPSFAEAIAWHIKSNQPARIFARNIKALYGDLKI